MVNSTQNFTENDVSIGALKSLHLSRRPFQPRSVNAPSAPSPGKSTMANKPQLNPLKQRPEITKKLEIVSENISEWPSINGETPTPSLESDQDLNSHPSIFRRRTCVHDQGDQDDDMFVLKRANPVYESEDEHYTSTPTKRQRTAESSVLHWGDRLSDDVDGNLSFAFLPAH